MYGSFSIGNVTSPSFLTLPERESKPRASGLTHVLDRGVSAAVAESVLTAVGEYVDLWKFGWGTAYLDHALAAKLALLAEAGVRPCVGGTLLELAWMQGKDRDCLDWALDAGFTCVEVSRGVAPMPREAKTELVHRASRRFLVLAEVGSKDPQAPLDAAEWTAELRGDLEAGARWAVAEGRESGTVGLYRADGSVREEIVTGVLDAAPVEDVLFEAPRKDQQAWFVNRFGPAVNLANVALDDVLGLETLRRGLRADTFALHHQWVPT